MKVFIDTGAWIALRIEKDKYAQPAKSHYNQLKRQRAMLFTNEHVLDELYTRLIYDIHLKAAEKAHKDLISAIVKNELTILEIDHNDRELAWEQLKKYSDHPLSFTDALIIANLKKYRLEQIFTYDSHFQDINLPINPIPK